MCWTGCCLGAGVKLKRQHAGEEGRWELPILGRVRVHLEQSPPVMVQTWWEQIPETLRVAVCVSIVDQLCSVYPGKQISMP